MLAVSIEANGDGGEPTIAKVDRPLGAGFASDTGAPFPPPEQIPHTPVVRSGSCRARRRSGSASSAPGSRSASPATCSCGRRPYGVNVLLWTVALLAALFALARWRRPLLLGARRVMLVPLLASAALFCWRDSSALALLNGVALRRVGGPLRGERATASGCARWRRARSRAPGAASRAPLAEGPAQVAAADVSWSELRLRSRARPARRRAPRARARGAAAAALRRPARQRGRRLRRARRRGRPGRRRPAAARARDRVSSAGSQRARCARCCCGRRRARRAARAARAASGAAEVVVALALLDVLFLAFVAVQLRTFFGGDAFVQGEVGLTYAEYAREGFFQLVAATALAVPLLLAAEWVVRGRGVRAVRASRALSLVLVALLLVVVASALQRLRLYQREFGLTESRVLATAAVLWLAVVLAWLAATVLSAAAGALRGRRARDRVRRPARAERAQPGRPDRADEPRAGGRGSRGRRALPRRARRGRDADARRRAAASRPRRRLDRLANALLERAGPDDWRSWNAGRARADELVRAREAELRAFAGRLASAATRRAAARAAARPGAGT